jgi:uncharacterized paraquat-inducible protein A
MTKSSWYERARKKAMEECTQGGLHCWDPECPRCEEELVRYAEEQARWEWQEAMAVMDEEARKRVKLQRDPLI